MTNDHAVREFGIAFLDPLTGWVGAMPHGFVTTDGGLHWHNADIGNAVNKIRLLRHGEGVTGFAIGTEVRRLRQAAPPAQKAETDAAKAPAKP